MSVSFISPWPRQWFSNFAMHKNYLKKFVKTNFLSLTPRDSDWVYRVGLYLHVCQTYRCSPKCWFKDHWHRGRKVLSRQISNSMGNSWKHLRLSHLGPSPIEIATTKIAKSDLAITQKLKKGKQCYKHHLNFF